MVELGEDKIVVNTYCINDGIHHERMDTLNICSTGDRLRVCSLTLTRTHHFQLRLFIYLFRASEHFDRAWWYCEMIWCSGVVLCCVEYTCVTLVHHHLCMEYACVLITTIEDMVCVEKYKCVLKISVGPKMKSYGRLVALLSFPFAIHAWAVYLCRPHIFHINEQ